MHIPKSLVVAVFLAVVGASPVRAQRPDTDIQAKAREALRQSLGQADTNISTNMPPPAAPSVQPPAQTVAPPPVQAPVQAPVATPPAQPAVAPAPVEERQFLMRPVPAAAAPAPVAPARAAPAPTETSAAIFMPSSEPPGGLTPQQEEAAREALRKAMDEANAKENPPAVAAPAPPKLIMQPPAEKPATPAPPPMAAPQTPVPAPVAVAPATSPSAPPPVMAATSTPMATVPAAQPVAKPPVSAPAPAVSDSNAMPSAADTQEARLAELLVLYKSDKITPAEYQARRAKILAGQ